MGHSSIGTHHWLLAHLLAGRGWYVHLLSCGRQQQAPAGRRRRQTETAVVEQLTQSGIGWSTLERFEPSAFVRAPGCFGFPNLRLSEYVSHALEQLHARHRFDLVEFADWGGLGFRSLQARRMGLAFTDLLMLVRLHGSSQWRRDGNRQWIRDLVDLEQDYLERYSFEHADFQVSSCRSQLEHAREVGWAVRSDAQVSPFPFPEPTCVPSDRPRDGTPELVFFGRLETRKGLEVFLQAVQQLPPTVRVTFLGQPGSLSCGTPVMNHVKARLRGRPWTALTEYNREQALRYLAAGHRLAVIPSLLDDTPFALLECLSNGIPFCAARVGGIAELVSDPEARERLLFDPTPRDLLRCLRGVLDPGSSDPRPLLARCQEQTDGPRINEQIADDYLRFLATERPDTSPKRQRRDCLIPTLALRACEQLLDAEPPPPSLVTVGVAYHNHGDYLPQALASLAAQTYPHLEVIVINDGSTDPRAQQVFAEQQARYPQFRFLTQENAGIGATRNRALAEAHGNFFLTLDADNLACPNMVERFVAAMHHNPDLSAITCFYLAFRTEEELRRHVFPYAYRPTGGPHVLAADRNVYGDASALFRTKALRAVGGYEIDRDSSWEDQELFIKLVNAGHRIDVLPDYLFCYRHLDSGWSKVTNNYLNHQRAIRQMLQAGPLPTAERIALWSALLGMQKRNLYLHQVLKSLRFRIADGIEALFHVSPRLKNGIRWLLRSGEKLVSLLRRGS